MEVVVYVEEGAAITIVLTTVRVIFSAKASGANANARGVISILYIVSIWVLRQMEGKRIKEIVLL